MATRSKYVYETPYVTRRELCRLLDLHDEWKELGGLMGYSTFDIVEIDNEYRRRGGSPSDSLLTLWGQQNHTVLELFALLARLKHNPAMNCLKDLVEAKYHILIEASQTTSGPSNIYSAEENTFSSSSQSSLQNRNRSASSKIQNGPPCADSFNEQVPPGKVIPTSSKVPVDPVAEGAQGVLKIMYSELKTATENWNTALILGKGGFGEVFSGTWKNTKVAIKRLKPSHGAAGVTNELLCELRYLNTCRHDNVLPLYGYSNDGKESCLVYQLMIGGSLEDRLKCRNGFQPLSWKHRLDIAEGVAKGLQFLHTVKKTPLIHGDIKSANILLDSCDCPRIGDFGLAREGPANDDLTHLKVSRIHGTRPYLPDEFLRGGKLSVKVDVYSFGVVVFELVTGEPAFCNNKKQYLKDHVVEYCKDSRLNSYDLQDYRLLHIGESNLELCKELLRVGLKCVEYKPGDRPNMVEVWKDLSALRE